MHRLVARLHRVAQDLVGAIRHHFVGIHVVAGARAGLEGIDHEMLMMLTVDDFVSRVDDGARQLRVQQAQLHVDLGRRPLDQRHAPDESRQGLHARDREVLQRALRLRRIERPLWHPYLADRVRLNAKFSHTRLLPFVVATVCGVQFAIKKSATIVAPFDFVENNRRVYRAAAKFSATCAQLITLKNAAM